MGPGFLVQFNPEPDGCADAKKNRSNEGGYLKTYVHGNHYGSMMTSRKEKKKVY
tara:strand:+ start:3276 stop:3437 length:162 start_codon:yes stop_codon:yes gene_type:complete